jgi:hypothetical protein
MDLWVLLVIWKLLKEKLKLKPTIWDFFIITIVFMLEPIFLNHHHHLIKLKRSIWIWHVNWWTCLLFWLCINLIKGPQVKYIIHVVLIQNINELLSQNNISLCHTLREGNQCVNFFAKLGASSYVDLSTHAFSPNCVRDLFKNDEMRIFFLRISSFF